MRDLGFAAYLGADAEETERYWGDAYTIRREIGYRQGIGDSLAVLGVLALTRGDWKKGKALAEELLPIARDISSSYLEHWALRLLDIAGSMETVARGSRVSPNAMSESQVTLFHLLWGFESVSAQYKGRLQRALRSAGNDMERIRCLPFAARLSASEGEQEQAVMFLALASSIPEFDADWVSLLTLIKGFHTRLESDLSPDVFSAAWERGQVLDLQATIEGLIEELRE